MGDLREHVLNLCVLPGILEYDAQGKERSAKTILRSTFIIDEDK